MPINYDDFLFHSDRIPFGSASKETINLNLNGVSVPSSGKKVLSNLIPNTPKSISPRMVHKIPSIGTWRQPFGYNYSAGTKIMTEFWYVKQVSPSIHVQLRPIVEYEDNGIKVGYFMTYSYDASIPDPGPVAMPNTSIQIQLSLDVIPKNIK